MPDNRQDELIALAEQRQREAAFEALSGIKAEVEISQRDYSEALAAGRSDDAAHALRQLASLQQQAASIAPLAAAGQQQGDPALTPEENEWIRNNPAVWANEEKRSEAIKAANSLVMRGYRRGSPEYFAAIEHWIGLTDASGAESNEIISPNEVMRICKSKYGDVTPDEYRDNAQLLGEMKRLGLYRNDQS